MLRIRACRKQPSPSRDRGGESSPQIWGKRGGFGREWRSEKGGFGREAGPASTGGGAARRWEGMGAAPRAEREERRGAEERGWSLRARILGFQLLLYGRSANRATRLEIDG